MNEKRRLEILAILDSERRGLFGQRLVREFSPDRARCEITYASFSDDEVDAVIRNEVAAATSGRYELEWKVYGHDCPACLGARLSAAGFVPGNRESFMAFDADQESLDRFGGSAGVIRKVTGSLGIAHYRAVIEEIRGEDRAEEIERYISLSESRPTAMSMYVGYVNGLPVTSGRIYFAARFAYLYGGNTRYQYRNRGLYSQVVAARVREAQERGIRFVFVDALPTSEPILAKRGFETLSYTQPYTFGER